MRKDIFWQLDKAVYDTSCTGCGLAIFKGDPTNTLYQPHHLQHLYCIDCAPAAMTTGQRT